MEDKDIKALMDTEKNNKAADNSMLFLWATAPKLPEALPVMYYEIKK
jgi:hypothetical protein